MALWRINSKFSTVWMHFDVGAQSRIYRFDPGANTTPPLNYSITESNDGWCTGINYYHRIRHPLEL